ncbi:hypothetical protein, partial [Mycobacterium marinum]
PRSIPASFTTVSGSESRSVSNS